MDFVTHLPTSFGKSKVLVIVNFLRKGTHFLPLKFLFTAPFVVIVFIVSIICYQGIPKTLLFDRDPIFLSSFWKCVFKAHGTKLLYNSAYHLQTNGQTEMVNQCLQYTSAASWWINPTTEYAMFTSPRCGIKPPKICRQVQPHLSWPMGDLHCPWSKAWIVH